MHGWFWRPPWHLKKNQSWQYARENKVPFFGICLGMQCAVIEYVVMSAVWKMLTIAEFAVTVSILSIDLMPEQVKTEDKGGTMRLGLYP